MRSGEQQRVGARAGPIFIGREQELASLRGLFADASDGRLRIACISGIAGIGKTALVREFVNDARTEGARVLWGGSHVGVTAYGAWASIEQAYLGMVVDGPQRREEHARNLDPTEPRDLLEGTVRFLRDASADQPVILVFDDAQASDSASIDLLTQLAKGEHRTGPVLAIVAARRVIRNPATVSSLAALGRVARRIDLNPFDREATGRFLAHVTAAGADPAIVRAAFAATGGIPERLRKVTMILEGEARISRTVRSMQRFAETMLESRQTEDRDRGREWQLRALQVQQGDHDRPDTADDIDTSAPTGNVFQKKDRHWTIRFGAEVARLPHRKGLAYLAILLGNPTRGFHVSELLSITTGRAAPMPDDVGPALDAEAKEAYRARIRDLEADLEDADRLHDPGRAERDRIEFEWLEAQLRSAIGLGGRDRTASATADRARVAVTKAIRSSIELIASAMPMLGAHLDGALKTGYVCIYDPPETSSRHWVV